MNNKLCLYTSEYPFGEGEQFLETEIKYLSDSFGKIYIFPLKKNHNQRALPENTFVADIPEFEQYSAKKALKYFGWWFFPVFLEALKFNHLKNALSITLKKGFQSQMIYNFLKRNKLSFSLQYTYWFDNWSTLLAVLKKRKKIKIFISRAHGYDLYSERSQNNFIPYRSFQIKHLDFLYLISKQGLEYIATKYPEYIEKYKLSYLGTKDYGHKFESKKDSIPLIVSCSNVKPLKRLYLIVEALMHIEFSINWIHIGDGHEMKNVKKLCEELPNNIKVTFKGHLNNKDVISFYQKNKVSLFINVSSTEGLPVSIMEAISFGIPVIATNVGGVSEIVNGITGMLISKDISPLELSNYIINLIKNNDSWNRSKIREYWKRYFNAESNYLKFIAEINSLL